MNRELEGVYPILVTPFLDDGTLDIDSVGPLVDHLLAQGAHGLGVFGNAGEGYTLLRDERRRLLATVVDRVGGRVPVVCGIGTTGSEPAVEASRRAEGQGADGLMVLPPYYLRPDADGVREFYAAVSDAVAIPIMVQDAPMLSQVAMPPSLLAQMGREIDRVRYAKVEAPPTSPKITNTLEASNGSLVLFGGLNGQFLIEECQRGARGTMPSSDMTAIYVGIWEALEAGAESAAWDLFRRALPLIRFELQPGLGVSAAKHNLVHEGVIRSARVRCPTRCLDADGLSELATLRSLVWPDRGP